MQKIGTAFYRHMQLLATVGALLKFALLFARGVFSLFVAAVLGFGLYVLSLPVALSIWGYGDSLVTLLVLATSVGAGIGSYITWFDRNFNLGVQALLLVVVLTCAVSGAWLGYGVGVGLDHPIWKPGIPETSVTTMGAVIGANVPLFLLGLYNAIRDPRL